MIAGISGFEGQRVVHGCHPRASTFVPDFPDSENGQNSNTNGDQYFKEIPSSAGRLSKTVGASASRGMVAVMPTRSSTHRKAPSGYPWMFNLRNSVGCSTVTRLVTTLYYL